MLSSHAGSLTTRRPAQPLSVPGRRAHLTARIKATRLDRELAAGAQPWRSQLHAARALQLTSLRTRDGFAKALDRLVARTYLNSPAITAAIPPNRAALRNAEPVIADLAARLRVTERPVHVQGMAQLNELLSDGAGPLYVPADNRELSLRISMVLETIEARG